MIGLGRTAKRGRFSGRPGGREGENIKVGLEEIEWVGVEEIHMANDWKVLKFGFL
jgi:hypothetical protein